GLLVEARRDAAGVPRPRLWILATRGRPGEQVLADEAHGHIPEPPVGDAPAEPELAHAQEARVDEWREAGEGLGLRVERGAGVVQPVATTPRTQVAVRTWPDVAGLALEGRANGRAPERGVQRRSDRAPRHEGSAIDDARASELRPFDDPVAVRI